MLVACEAKTVKRLAVGGNSVKMKVIAIVVTHAHTPDRNRGFAVRRASMGMWRAKIIILSRLILHTGAS
jgi:hypothetical protein